VAAWVYNVASLVGLPPAKKVERELGLPRTTASKWIRRARDMGLISPEERNTDGKH
jgi:transposase-like protein